MGGGLMQLVAYGAQDIYLTGNPQITFFKVVYRRHTNFSMEAIEQTWNGTSDGTNGRCTATISRNGDLVHRMYLEVTGKSKVDLKPLPFGGDEPDTYQVCASHTNPGVGWIKTVELEIGGQKIDQHSGVWMETWAELTQENPSSLVGAINAVSGNSNETYDDNDIPENHTTVFQGNSGHGGVFIRGNENDARYLSHLNEVAPFVLQGDEAEPLIFTVPLQFWFCRNVGLALPLIALQYHEVKVILEHSIDTYFTGGKNRLYADYIYLDTDERRRFAQVSHEYLIEQVQEQQLQATTNNKLNFNHPVKELIWTSTEAQSGEVNSCSLKSPCPIDTEFTLKLNGQDRFSSRKSTYFSRTQVVEHHTGPGGLQSERPTLENNIDFAISSGEAEAVNNLLTTENPPSRAGRTVEDGAVADGAEVEDGMFGPDGPDGGKDYILPFLGDMGLRGAGEENDPAGDAAVLTELRGDLMGDAARDVVGWHQAVKYTTLRNGFECSQKGMLNDSICVYSFALKPEEHQPSGTCNFSRIDSAILDGQIQTNYRGVGQWTKRELTYDNDKMLLHRYGLADEDGNLADSDRHVYPSSGLFAEYPLYNRLVTEEGNIKPQTWAGDGSEYLQYADPSLAKLANDDNVAKSKFNPVIFAVNYNVLRIMSGMGGLAYSN